MSTICDGASLDHRDIFRSMKIKSEKTCTVCCALSLTCIWLTQLLKQSRGNPTMSSHRAWELFYLVASTMPPSKDFVGLVSEYVHTVAHNEAEDPSVKVMAQSTWSSLKRSAKAGARRTVSSHLSFAFKGKARFLRQMQPQAVCQGWRSSRNELTFCRCIHTQSYNFSPDTTANAVRARCMCYVSVSGPNSHMTWTSC